MAVGAASEVRIRRMEPGDVDAVVGLTAQVAPEGALAVEPGFDESARRAWLSQSLGGTAGALFVAVDGDEVVGNIGIGLQPYGVAQLGMLVAPERRRQGIGAALLAAAVGWARDAGAHKVALEVWPDNAAAIALYGRTGFRREGLLIDHYRRADGSLRGAVVMGLRL